MDKSEVILRVKFNVVWREWAVYHSDGQAKDYYCEDLEDALDTREAMAEFEVSQGREVVYSGVQRKD